MLTVVDLAAGKSVNPDANLRELLLLSCHATLIRLGDLSRYRATEVQSRERDWGPSKSYYDLAITLQPTSGMGYNQLAIIALADEDHFHVTYYLHRSLAVDHKFTTNLDIEFKKILDRESKHREPSSPKDDPGFHLFCDRFVVFHAKCHKGRIFKEHDALENELLNQLAAQVQGRTFDDVLQKICLINIAAESLAKKRVVGECCRAKFELPNLLLTNFTDNVSRSLQSVVYLQELNVRTFFTLLQAFLAELEQNGSNEGEHERLTSVCRRLLPQLRQYSSWLRIESALLLAQEEETLAQHIKEFWKVYARVLDFLLAAFPLAKLPEAPYLLSEDQDTMAFKPLRHDGTTDRYLNVHGNPKPLPGSEGKPRLSSDDEMLYRVKSFLKDGLKLTMAKVGFLIGKFARADYNCNRLALPKFPFRSQEVNSFIERPIQTKSLRLRLLLDPFPRIRNLFSP